MPIQSHDSHGLTVGRLMQRRPETIRVFLRHGMFCVGCTINALHTIDEVCSIYVLDSGAFRKELRETIRGSGPSRRIPQAYEAL